MLTLGVDVGYSSVKMILINEENVIKYSAYKLHKGEINATLNSFLSELLSTYSQEQIQYGAVTGSGSKFLSKDNAILAVNEVSSIIEGALLLNSNVASIIELGGRGGKYITGFAEKELDNLEFSINSNCSAGTGSFLEEQVARLDLRLEDYSQLIEKASSIPNIAGRCSVFAKTDIVHRQQEGVPKEDILLGVAYAVVRNFRGTIIKKLPIRKPVAFVGGVASNRGMVKAFRDTLSLEEKDFIVPSHFNTTSAIGAAVLARKNSMRVNIATLLKNIADTNLSVANSDTGLAELASYGTRDSLNRHDFSPIEQEVSPIPCFIGVDIGSTSTNIALIDDNRNVFAFRYLKTLGDPVTVIQEGLKSIYEEFGQRIAVRGVGITGSGRYMIGRLLGADFIKDEITAQAKAALHFDPEVDTIFEIGGQDSKYIQLADGLVVDFEMNKICAAGTGSFLEEQANKFQIPINMLGEVALAGKNPVSLGEKCTVFMETNIAGEIAKGTKTEDIAAGLCYSVVNNYLHKVVGRKKIGEKILLQGGLAYNQGVVNAFRAVLGREIAVSPFFSVTGAIGAALLAKENMLEGSKSKFKGFNVGNEAKQFAEPAADEVSEPVIIDEGARTEKLFLAGYDGQIEASKETIGIPRVLFFHKLFPMFNVFFRKLGFNVILSEKTTQHTVSVSQKYVLEETCFPIKLINGHIAELIDKEVDYIFLPSLYTMKHPRSKVREDYACTYMQSLPQIIENTMDLKSRGIKLLSPALSFNFGKAYMMQTLFDLGANLRKSKVKTALALKQGMATLLKFTKEVEKIGQKAMEDLAENERVFVIITRAYGVTDPVLNMGIAKIIRKMGYKVLTLSNLPAYDRDISQEYPNMYWPFGQHILAGAQIVKEHPNMYPIYLTNHGCGPDSIIYHLFKEEMAGKPYLHLEVDEHASNVGVKTRIEAFINSVESTPVAMGEAKDLKRYKEKEAVEKTNIQTNIKELNREKTILIQHSYPYADILKEIFLANGFEAEVLPPTNKTSHDIGKSMTSGKEYFSLTTLLGDVFHKIKGNNCNSNNFTFFVPQTEGAEAYGQYNRLLRDKLNESGLEDADVFAPFIEDLIDSDSDKGRGLSKQFFLGLLAGDIIRVAMADTRDNYLARVTDLICNNRLNINGLVEIAKELEINLKNSSEGKKIYVLGEPGVMFNDYVNHDVLKDMEKNSSRVIYSPYSEMVWFMLHDFSKKRNGKSSKRQQQVLTELMSYMEQIGVALLEYSPFTEKPTTLHMEANKKLNLFSGGYGRYRLAKTLSVYDKADGILTVSSMYENTGVILKILRNGGAEYNSKPIMDLEFDGEKATNTSLKVETFLHYL